MESLSRGRFGLRTAGVSLLRCSLLGTSVLLAGCASDEAERREAYRQAAYAAQLQAQQQRRAEPELEEDGLPSQSPPLVRRNVEPDDPSEPFSPNYGRPVVMPQRAASVTGAAVSYRSPGRATN